MKIKNNEVRNLVKEFGEVYEKFCKMKNEVEKELEYWNEEENWSEKSFREDEEYGMCLYVMKEKLEEKN